MQITDLDHVLWCGVVAAAVNEMVYVALCVETATVLVFVNR